MEVLYPMVPIPGKWAGILLALLLVATVTGSPAAGSLPAVSSTASSPATAIRAAIPGDCNGDGQISAVDALMALQMTTGKLQENAIADMDGDGVVQVSDVLLIMQKSAKTVLVTEKERSQNPVIPPLTPNTTPTTPTPAPILSGIFDAGLRLLGLQVTPGVAIPRDVVNVATTPTPILKVVQPEVTLGVAIPRDVVTVATTPTPILKVVQPEVLRDVVTVVTTPTPILKVVQPEVTLGVAIPREVVTVATTPTPILKVVQPEVLREVVTVATTPTPILKVVQPEVTLGVAIPREVVIVTTTATPIVKVVQPEVLQEVVIVTTTATPIVKVVQPEVTLGVAIPREVVTVATTAIPIVKVVQPIATPDPCIVSGGTWCPAGSSTGTCVYPLQDPLNCGSCGNACPQGVNWAVSCNSGQCRIECNTGYGNCDSILENGCETNLMTSASSCGACGTMCASGTQCVNGVCTILLKKTIIYSRL
jgi:hypothetical protein